MEIRVLRYFVEVAREENITHAALRLHISQPTLSKQLKDLEAELGKKLFKRSSSSVHLTQEGLLLYKRAQDILEMVDKTTKEFQSLKEMVGGDVHIGCAESENISYIARRFKALQKRYPNICFQLCSGDTQDLRDRLDQGLFDFALIVQDPDLSKYNALKLPGHDRWGVLMLRNDRLSHKETISCTDLIDVPLIVSRQGIQDDLLQVFGELVDQLHIVATFNLAYNASILVKEGLGYALTFDRIVETSPENGLCFRPLALNLEVSMYLIWKKHQIFSPAAQAFLEEIKTDLIHSNG